METYSRIGLVRSYGNLQSYWTITKLWKLTVILDYYEAMETYSRIGLLRSYGNLQSYCPNLESPLDKFKRLIRSVQPSSHDMALQKLENDESTYRFYVPFFLKYFFFQILINHM